MNTIRKTTITLLMIFLTAAFATTSAAEGGQVAEAGVIQAEGTGEVWAFGRGKVVYRLEGEGTLTVRNVLANSVTSNGDGIRTVDGATVVYSEFKGTVTIEGPSISANSKGGAVVFVASGIGCVVFAGTGTYQKDGADPQEWQLTGTSVLMGQSADDDNAQAGDAEDEDAEYEQQTVIVVREIRTFPRYNEWALAYPEAAVVLSYSRNYYGWSVRFPIASAALYYNDGWGFWLSSRPFLSVFFGHHHGYVRWRGSYPVYGSHFRHPYAYHRWRTRHHGAHRAVSSGVSYSYWARRHPSAARGLSRRIAPRRNGARASVRGRAQVSSRRVPSRLARVERVRTGRPSRPVRIESARTSRPSRSVRTERVRTGRSQAVASGGATRPRHAADVERSSPARRSSGSQPRSQSSVVRSEAPASSANTSRFEEKQIKLGKRSERIETWYSRRVEKKSGNEKGLANLQRRYDNKHAKVARKTSKAQAWSGGSVQFRSGGSSQPRSSDSSQPRSGGRSTSSFRGGSVSRSGGRSMSRSSGRSTSRSGGGRSRGRGRR